MNLNLFLVNLLVCMMYHLNRLIALPFPAKHILITQSRRKTTHVSFDVHDPTSNTIKLYETYMNGTFPKLCCVMDRANTSQVNVALIDTIFVGLSLYSSCCILFMTH